MKNYSRIITILIILTISNLLANEVNTIYNELSNLSILNNKVAVVNDFSFSRDVADFHFNQGKLYLLSPVNGKTIAAIFMGDGIVSITPPTKISRERFYSEFQAETYSESFDLLFMVFTDSTLAEFSHKLDFDNDLGKSNFQANVDSCMESLYNKIDKVYEHSLIQTILNDEEDGYFYAHISKGNFFNKSTLFFEFNPNQTEEVSLKVSSNKGKRLDHNHKIVSMFHQQEDYLSSLDLSFENKDKIYVDKYTIDATITNRMDFSATCSLDFHGLKNSGKWIALALFDKLRISSISNAKADSLNFFKADKSNVLWVELPEKLNRDEKYKISINYEGDLISQGGMVVKIRDFDYWYPQYPTYNNKLFDLTFHYPSSYNLISVGEKVFEEKNKQVTTARWITKYPVNYAPFNMGKFKNELFANPKIPTLSLHLHKNLKNAKADVANSIAFYQSVYGNCKFDSLTVVEIPRFLSGEAYPGLINFYSDDFITDAVYKVYFDIDINETDFVQLRAHEVAHQWWGCGVGSRTYHDKWLFEGLAEFSSIWFIQTSLNDTQKYFDYLSKWRTKILNESKLASKRGETEYPLWLGARAPYYINYFKGGWIFHMIRSLMIDLNTYDETSFKTMMQDFYNTYKNSTATTKDFKNILEKHMKMDMTWFFEQWVYGNEIPEFKFDYDIIKKEDGKFYANCKIEQNNVNSDFKSYIPIEFDFGNNQKARIRTLVQGSGKVLEIPLPQAPQKINFNILDAVLSNN